ncbi:OLC1v1010293C1 [Oldenlandia corymbosa var. corymbosa]|uniref:OLC1v1010293C1 n=1 Tax=Oldenlandia corymbosa var. corymbosa TaxID=529605 RepID=A0AAV1DU06_OLDCO|nr:OLC1v1010293C1 [Oldenlandia corymbosa var. corymbosa]
MSLSRLGRRTRLFPYFTNSVLHAQVLSRDYNGIIGARYNFVGANNHRYIQYFGVQSRNLNGFISRYEVNNRVSLSKSQEIPSAFSTPNVGGSCIMLNLRHQYATKPTTEQKSRKMLIYLTGLVFAMVGMSYAAVPLYRRFCQATGYGGTIQRRESVEEKIARHAKDGTVTKREVVVQFNADVADGMPWKFTPTQREVRVKPGESALAFYTAENRSSTPITGVSTYNVTPMKAAVYFNKIQCFCFEEQRLLPGEQIDMPVFFYIDPEFETDPRMDGINNLILSYTFFKVSEE